MRNKDRNLDLDAFDLASKHVDDKPKKNYEEVAPKDLAEVRNDELSK